MTIAVIIILLVIVTILLFLFAKQRRTIQHLKSEISGNSLETESTDNDLIFWLRFPLYCCLVFCCSLLILMLLSITGIYKFSTIQMFFLTASSFFFVASDLCLIGMQMEGSNISPKWIQFIGRDTSRNAYKRFFWIAFVCFIVSFIVHPFEITYFKELTDIYNSAFGIMSLCLVIFIYGLRSIESMDRYFKKR